nr:ATP-binding protein [Streptomyces sp. CBMA29]
MHRARHLLVETLHEWKLGDLADSASLVIAELMTNSVQHGRPCGGPGLAGHQIGVRLSRLDHGVRIEVHDGSDLAPKGRSSDPELLDEHGRGLALVDAITDGCWGVGPRGGIGKVVWAEVRGEGAECGVPLTDNS